MAKIKCPNPKCASTNIEKKIISQGFGAITEFGKLPPTRKIEKHRCEECGQIFEILPDGSIRRT